MQNIDQEFRSTKYTPYLTLTGKLLMPFLRIWKNSDPVITVPHCMYLCYIPFLNIDIMELGVPIQYKDISPV